MEQFDLEHSIVESGIRGANQFEVLELPLSRRIFTLLLAAGAVFSLAVGARIYVLAVSSGDFYKNRSAMNVAKPITIPAIRGKIYDRFGNSLVKNDSAYRLVLNPGLAKRRQIDLKETIAALSEILWQDSGELLSILEKTDLEKSALVTLAHNLSEWEAAAIQKLNNPALEIQDDYRRQYLRGSAFAHVLGYTGLGEYRDLRGKTGLEAYYDNLLGGEDGLRLMYRDAQGNILEEKLLDAPKNGEDLYTTIDAELQEYFYNSLAGALRNLGRQIGVGIALNPQNGELLALVNLPSYNNNVFTLPEEKKARARLLTSSLRPLFNRAVSGVYTPGSTVKPLVALAALNEGLISPADRVYSSGVLEIPNPYFPDKPSRFLDWKAHGWVDLRAALARSSNVYFYAVGGGIPADAENPSDIKKGLGIEKLKEYWQKFGFGEKTGIDLDAENTGFLPDPREKEARAKDIWRLGDTYNVTIGQGDLLVTPIQLITQIASIANGGKLYRPHLFKNNKEVLKDFSDLASHIKEVQEGMKDAVQKWYGTAHLLADLPVSVAAKTGSSQVANNARINAFFVGYSPVENPEIAILVLIENAREGSLNAVPVAKDVLDWYYWNRLVK
ncbi:MAG: hypothetical protein HYY86_03480 [Candidatus Harrisonbacteria bacterium]|nr:hypothetical protein [Candidatus Harrisonbacteria bacterium]